MVDQAPAMIFALSAFVATGGVGATVHRYGSSLRELHRQVLALGDDDRLRLAPAPRPARGVGAGRAVSSPCAPWPRPGARLAAA